MNILLINDYLEGGGAEAVFRDQFEILQKDYQVEMFYAFKNISDSRLSPLSYIYSFRFKRKLQSFIEKRRFDFIIIHNYNGALSPSVLDILRAYKNKNKSKLIHYAHDFHLVCPNRGYFYVRDGRTINFQSPPTLFSLLFKRLDYRSAGHSLLKKLQWIWAYSICKKQNVFDLILAPSDFLTNQIRLSYPAVEINRLYNSCNAMDIKPKEKKEKSDTLRLVYFGRLAQEKGLIDFIRALKLSTVNYSFTMIGEGEEKKSIQAFITKHKLQDKIFLKSKMNHSDLFAELQNNYDVFVLPSLWYENAPLSIIEAASVGLGLFLSHHGGVAEMGKICNASHFFNPSDTEDIVLKLEILYRDFLAGVLPQPDKERLHALFSKETYIKNLKSYLAQ